MSDKKVNTALLDDLFGNVFDVLDKSLEKTADKPFINETGEVIFVGKGIARIRGLSGISADELIEFPGNKLGFAFNLDRNMVDAVMLDGAEELSAGYTVKRGRRVTDIPVGEELLGRIIDPLGRPLDGGAKISGEKRMPVEREAPPIMHRAPVEVPLQSGIQVIDSLIPIGRGQRELILGDRQTGKTAIAVDTMINQKNSNVVCIYCAIGKRNSAIAKVISDIEKHGIGDKTVVIKASGDDTPGMNYLAPYAAATIGEFFMENGKDSLVVFDDLTNHARSYRELSLLLRRPPAREAYPGDIFYLHSRLLERSTHLRDEYGGGSMTAIPIIETEEQNMSAYIPTNLISITDGQIYLSPRLFQEGILPAIDAGKSVSRVGGKTQLPAYRDVAGDLRLSYSQFEELEAFSRFGTKLDEETRRKLRRGRRVREVFKQEQYQTIPVPMQIAVLLAVTNGIFDDIDTDNVQKAKKIIRDAFKKEAKDLYKEIAEGGKLGDDDKEKIMETAEKAVEELKSEK